MSHHNHHKKKSPLTRILLIFAIVVSGAFWGFTLYTDYEIYEGTYDINAADHLNITNIEFHYNVEVGSVDIDIVDQTTDSIMQSRWKHLFGAWGASDVVPIELEFENYTVGTTLVIIATSTGDLDDYNVYNGINVWEFDILLNPNFIYNFTTEGSVSSVDLFALNTEFDGLNLNHETGSVDLELYGVNVTGGISSQLNTGSISIELENTAVEGEINLETNTGYIDVETYNSITETISVATDTGSVETNLYETEVMGDLSLLTNTGYIDIELYTSPIGAISATTDTGSIEVYQFNTTIDGNQSYNTGTGYIDVEIYEMGYTTAKTLTLESGTGSIEFYLYQSSLPNTIIIDMTTNTGYLDADIYIPEAEQSQIIASAASNTGTTDLNYHYL